MVNMMAAYRLAVRAGVAMPPAVLAPPVPQEYIDRQEVREEMLQSAEMLELAAATGGVIMYDSTNPGAIPMSADLVAAYVDGYGGYPAAVARFGAAKCVSISVGNNDAMVADVEPGAMTAAELAGWAARQKARGLVRPGIYSDGSQYPSCLAAAGSSCSYWTATDSGIAGQTLSGRDAVQYDFAGSYDLSWCLPTWPWYPGTVVNPPTPTPTSNFPLTQGSTDAADVRTLQANLNKWASVLKLSPVLVVDGDFGQLTAAAVTLAQVHFGERGVAAGTCDQALFNDLTGTSAPAPAPAPAPTPSAGTVVIDGFTVSKPTATEVPVVVGWYGAAGVTRRFGTIPKAAWDQIAWSTVSPNPAPIPSPAPAQSPVSQAQVNAMLAYCEAQEGKPYGFNPPTGPNEFDCAGLIWAAFNAEAGITLPTAGIGDPWTLLTYMGQHFGSGIAAAIITDHSKIQAGDIIFFDNTGAGAENVSISGWSGSIGHVGDVISSTEYVCAWSTAVGVAKMAIPFGNFAVAIRLQDIS